MPSAIFRISGLALIGLLVSGCGGKVPPDNTNVTTGPTTNVTFTITGPTPIAVAGQIGSAAFALPTLSSSGVSFASGVVTLALPVGTTNFAIAYICPASQVSLPTGTTQQTNQYVYEATTLDGTSFTGSCPNLAAAYNSTGALTGTIDASAFAGASLLVVDAQGTSLNTSGDVAATGSSFSLQAPVGTDTVEVVAYDSVANGSATSISAAAEKVISNQPVPGALNGGNPVVLGAGDQTVEQPITYSNAPQGFSAPTTLATLETGSGGAVLLANAATAQYPAVPEGALQSSNYYSFDSIAYATTPGSGGVEVMQAATAAGPLSVAFPPPWSYGGPSPAAFPLFYFSNYTGFAGSGSVSAGISLTWPLAGPTQNVFTVNATLNALSSSPTLTIPNLSNLMGFIAAPPSGAQVQWTAKLSQGSSPPFQPKTSTGSVSNVFNSGTFLVP
jgi:hypothetical protein